MVKRNREKDSLFRNLQKLLFSWAFDPALTIKIKWIVHHFENSLRQFIFKTTIDSGSSYGAIWNKGLIFLEFLSNFNAFLSRIDLMLKKEPILTFHTSQIHEWTWRGFPVPGSATNVIPNIPVIKITRKSAIPIWFPPVNYKKGNYYHWNQ